MFFEGFKEFKIEISPSITIAGVQGGNGTPLLLLHGFPQSHHIWHRVAPELSKTYTVIAMDLRGYGASSKPKGDEKHSHYAKSAMATDCASLMSKLGHEIFFVCAHDRGARVAHKLCVEYLTFARHWQCSPRRIRCSPRRIITGSSSSRRCRSQRT
jgi:haloacetate dehalogenase